MCNGGACAAKLATLSFRALTRLLAAFFYVIRIANHILKHLYITNDIKLQNEPDEKIHRVYILHYSAFLTMRKPRCVN